MDVNHKVRKGYRIDLGTIWKNPDGTLMSLAGLSARVQLRSDYVENSGTLLATFTSSSPSVNGDTVTITTGTSRIDILFKPATTAGLIGGRNYFWELQVLNATGEPVKGIAGVFLVQPTIYS